MRSRRFSPCSFRDSCGGVLRLVVGSEMGSQSAGPSASASRAGSEMERLPPFRRAEFVRPCVDAQPERILLLLDTRDDLRTDSSDSECPWRGPGERQAFAEVIKCLVQSRKKCS